MPNRPDFPEGYSRRDFVRLLGLGGAAAFAGACASRAGQIVTTTPGPTPLGIQLYTMRSVIQADPAGVLNALGAIGYREVETAGTAGRTPAEFRQLLDAAGLRSPSGHYPIERMRSNMAGVIDEARALGQTWIVAPYLAAPERTGDGYRRLAADLDRANEAARTAGMRVAYHNHDFEFLQVAGAPEGQNGFDILLAESRVPIELDLFWITKAGRKPAEYFAKYPGRFPLVHVKDMTAAGAMADVGAGTIDFRGIFADSTAGIRHFFVERDDTTDPLATARASFVALRGLKG